MSKEVTTWRQVSPQEVHVVSSAGWLFRSLGVPFIAFAGYLLYLLADALYEYARQASGAEWLAATPGFLILGFLALLFLAPGWFLTCTRIRTELDVERGEVREVRDFIVYRRVKRHDARDFDRVEVSLEEVKYRHGESGSYRTLVSNKIALRGRSADEVILGLIDDDNAAAELGQQIAELLGLEHVSED